MADAGDLEQSTVVAAVASLWHSPAEAAVSPLAGPQTHLHALVLEGETVVPGEGDTLVLLDTWWNRATSGRPWRRRGTMERPSAWSMYDLLPVTHPEYFKPNFSEAFATSLQIALEQGDYFIAISDAVRDALRDYAVRARAAAQPAPGFLCFVSTRGRHWTWSTRTAACGESLQRRFCRPVGQPLLPDGGHHRTTQEPCVADGRFRPDLAAFPDAGVCIVGRIGWLCEELVQRIVRHPQYGRSLFMFNDLSDSELALLLPARQRPDLPVACRRFWPARLWKRCSTDCTCWSATSPSTGKWGAISARTSIPMSRLLWRK